MTQTGLVLKRMRARPLRTALTLAAFGLSGSSGSSGS